MYMYVHVQCTCTLYMYIVNDKCKRREERCKQGHTSNKAKQHNTSKAVTFQNKNELCRVGFELYNHVHVHVLMRDEKEGRKKQARSNKQTRQSNTAHQEK